MIGIDNIHESGKTEEDSKFDLEFKQKLDEKEQGIEVAKGDGNGENFTIVGLFACKFICFYSKLFSPPSFLSISWI